MSKLSYSIIVVLITVVAQFGFADELPNTFSVANAQCLEDVAAGEEASVLPPVVPDNLNAEQTNLVARVTATFKKSWKNPAKLFGARESVSVDTSREFSEQTSDGIIMSSLEPPEKNKDFARLTHEMCHSVGNKSNGYSNYGEQLGKDCKIGKYGSMTTTEFMQTWPNSPRDPGTGAHHEHFAEACTLFLLNPDRLKKVCPQGYEKMTKVFGGDSESNCKDKGPTTLAAVPPAGGSASPLLAAGLLPLILGLNNSTGGDPKVLAPAAGPKMKAGESSTMTLKPSPAIAAPEILGRISTLNAGER